MAVQLSYTKKVVGYMQVDGERLGDFQEGGWGGCGGGGRDQFTSETDVSTETDRQKDRRGDEGQDKDRERIESRTACRNVGMQEC